MTGRVAVVTGAGSGIGRVVAQALMAAGYRVALLGRRESELRETAAGLGATGQGAALVLPCDVTDAAAVEAAFDAVTDAWGRVDLLFNNAGRSAPAVPIDELPVETWRAVVEVNLTGAFLCARAAFARMRRQAPQGGRIVNNGSISAQVPRPFSAAYTASKHAITGLTRQIALDGRAWGITCGQIDIGNAATEMTERMAAGVLQANGTMAPEPRMDAADVARAVLYMDSLPPGTTVLFLTVMAAGMPFVGRG
jgi:NAD(P)-dependent dehydrogenase (short-subunit alcohol dehydrogenase family)